MRAFESPPQNGSGFDAIKWAAYYAAPSAAKLGVLREWMRGEPKVLREIARALPILAGMIEREKMDHLSQF